jgi:hypothetical protein
MRMLTACAVFIGLILNVSAAAAGEYRVSSFNFDGRCFQLSLRNSSSRDSTGSLVIVWGNVGTGYYLESSYEMNPHGRQDIRGCYESSRAETPNPASPRYPYLQYIFSQPTPKLYVIIDGKLERSGTLP